MTATPRQPLRVQFTLRVDQQKRSVLSKNESTEVPESLCYYIDCDAIARNMVINGEITEIERGLIVTNAHAF